VRLDHLLSKEYPLAAGRFRPETGEALPVGALAGPFLVVDDGGDSVLLSPARARILRPLFRFEGATDSVAGLWPPLHRCSFVAP
jgi:hypothetical protein